MPRHRNVVVVDVKTSGDDFNVLGYVPVEFAWWNLTTGARGDFLVKHNVRLVTDLGDPQALRALRYVERGLAEQDQDLDHAALIRLEGQLYDNTLAAVDPTRVARLLTRQYSLVPAHQRPQWGSDFPTNEPWHSRLLDLTSFACGVLATAPDQLAGLDDIAATLDITPADPGTAAGDVDTAGRCLLELTERSIDHRERAARRFFLGRARRHTPTLTGATL
ncbi:hypothetical protein [Amycolatopsis kentuckyensis]|uniref:hypothetical protein n=1 Tax=Amycolatopsis kentuckyensis TaxID=218823 RepID=UPI0035682A82